MCRVIIALLLTGFCAVGVLVSAQESEDKPKSRKEVIFQKDLPNDDHIFVEREVFEELHKVKPPDDSRSGGEQKVIYFQLFLKPKDKPQITQPIWQKKLFADIQSYKYRTYAGLMRVYDAAIGEKSGCLLVHFEGEVRLYQFDIPNQDPGSFREIGFFTGPRVDSRNGSVIGGQIAMSGDEIICLLKFKSAGYSERWKIADGRSVLIESIGTDPTKPPPTKQEKLIDRLIKDLVGSDAAKWNPAHEQLLDIGLPARGWLERALNSAPGAGAKSRIEKLLSQIPDSAAQTVLVDALSKMGWSQSYRFSGVLNATLTANLPNGESNKIELPRQTTEGFRAKDFSYIKTYSDDTKDSRIIETYQQGFFAVFRKSPKENWKKTVQINGGPGSSIFQTNTISRLMDIFPIIRFGHPDRCQGVDCRVIEIPLKGKKALENLPQDVFEAIKDIKEMSMQYKVWVGPDLLIYKIAIAVDMIGEIAEPGSEENISAKASLYIDINIMDYGKEIKTPMPEAVKKLLEKQR